MKGKRGSAGEWFFVFLIAIVVGGLVLFISSNIFYKKSEVYVKDEVDELLEDSCTYLHFSDTTYFGQTPRSICENLEMEPEFLLIREVSHVTQQDSGFTTYVDENHRIDTLLFDEPLGGAVDREVSYGNPSFINDGKTNTLTQGLLCCR